MGVGCFALGPPGLVYEGSTPSSLQQQPVPSTGGIWSSVRPPCTPCVAFEGVSPGRTTAWVTPVCILPRHPATHWRRARVGHAVSGVIPAGGDRGRSGDALACPPFPGHAVLRCALHHPRPASSCTCRPHRAPASAGGVAMRGQGRRRSLARATPSSRCEARGRAGRWWCWARTGSARGLLGRPSFRERRTAAWRREHPGRRRA